MEHKIIKVVVLVLSVVAFNTTQAQNYIAKDGEISFFSESLLEDISAVNNKVGSVYNTETQDLVFQLKIEDFIFPDPLMQEHFNENYLESDIYPKSTFIGKVIENKEGKARVKGKLTIHGITNEIDVEGKIKKEGDNIIIMTSIFSVKLVDYKIKIPKVVMYKIAEEIEIKVAIELKNN